MSASTRMPVLFVGHGSPMVAIEDNQTSRLWGELAASLPKPKAILAISAHWETPVTAVTAMANPKTIHDFGAGFHAPCLTNNIPPPAIRPWPNVWPTSWRPSASCRTTASGAWITGHGRC